MKKSLLSGLALTVVLTGCTADQSDLQGYVNQVKARPAGRVEPLPEFAPYETFVYAASGRRAPFEPPISAEQMLAQRTAQVSEIQPPVDHTPQPLELYAISDLRMIGYVDHQGARWATLQDAAGSVILVRTTVASPKLRQHILNYSKLFPTVHAHGLSGPAPFKWSGWNNWAATKKRD